MEFDKQKKQLAVIALGIPFLIVMTINNVKLLKDRPKQSPSAPQGESPAQSAPAAGAGAAAPDSPTASGPSFVSKQGEAAPSQVAALQLERSKAAWGRDPFTAMLDKGFGERELRLQGISFGKNKTGYAYINNEIVKKGDKIGDYEVVAVEKKQVLIRKEGQEFYLAFPE